MEGRKHESVGDKEEDDEEEGEVQQGASGISKLGDAVNWLKFDMVPYFGLINCPTVAKIFSCKKWVFKPNLHKTDKRYSVKTYWRKRDK